MKIKLFFLISFWVFIMPSMAHAGRESLTVITGENVTSNKYIMQELLNYCGKMPIRVRFVGTVKNLARLPLVAQLAAKGCRTHWVSRESMSKKGITKIPAWGYKNSKGELFIGYGDNWNVSALQMAAD